MNTDLGRPGEPGLQAVMDQENKFLQFELDGEYYGVDILKVREINGLMDITAVPQTPLFMKGLINLRGKVVPVIDLRLKFGLPEYRYDERTSIIVIEIKSVHGQVQMGIVVDTVSEVVNIRAENIEPAPNFGARLKSDYIRGMAKAKGRVIIILDIDLILTDEELTFGA
ncbi:MAG: chemotaxis protein CheW [Candidatus Adiutrix sp.]|jgi:purine-binding chemotaxis protein CheW|nr:chemotaxis protein CheW [Candidatus Adiutrix sp.]